MKTRTKNILITLLCSVLICTGLLTVIAKWTDGSFDIVKELRGDRNEANLIGVEDIVLKTQKLANGLEIEVDEEGVVEIKGKATEDWEATVAVLTLDAGTYTVSGYDTNMARAGIKVLVNNAPHYAGVENQDNGATFTLTEQTTVTVKIFVKKDVSFLAKAIFRPGLAMGSAELDFFA